MSKRSYRRVAQLVVHRSPKPGVGGSSPSAPARTASEIELMQWNPVTWLSESRQFLTEVRSEFRKVTWPTQKEATAGTIGVVVVVTLITTVLSLVDMLLGQAVQWIVP